MSRRRHHREQTELQEALDELLRCLVQERVNRRTEAVVVRTGRR